MMNLRMLLAKYTDETQANILLFTLIETGKLEFEVDFDFIEDLALAEISYLTADWSDGVARLEMK